MTSRLPLLLLLLATCFATAGVPPREVAPTDKAKFGRLVLDNGLRVLLVSDPAFNKSAASIVVGVGQLEDPAEITGMAHFTEHMLFLGTEKYPTEGEYGIFVKSNGGSANAYTSSDHTNYQFDIRHEAFDDALDRFAQFFIAPLFTPEFTAREINAVHNEAQRHVQNDPHRIHNVLRELYTPGSAESRFTAGNKDTLAHADSASVRTFFESRYSAERMALCLTGTASLPELETLARRHFTALPRRDVPPLTRTPSFQPRQPALRLARVEPVRELRQLQLQFILGPTRPDFAAKNDRLLITLLTDSSPGGLTAMLKERGLALAVNGGVWERCAGYGSFMLQLDLTTAGVERFPAVIELIFNYLAFLRTSPFPAELWAESARLAQLNETYQDRGEGASLAARLANNALTHPLDLAERIPYLWVAPDEAGYRDLLAQLSPDNFIAVLAAQGLPTDRTEQIYGTAYSYSEDTGPIYQNLVAAASSSSAAGLFQLPAANSLIPTETNLLTERPLALIDEPGLVLFHAPDLEFLRPQTTLQFRFRGARALGLSDPAHAMRLALFNTCLRDALDASADEAARAGLTFNVSVGLAGLNLTATGFGDSPVAFARRAAVTLSRVGPSPERFAVLKDRFLRGLRSFPQSEAFRLARAHRGAWTEEFGTLPTDWISAAETVTWDEVAAAARAFFAAGRLEGVIHGHLSAEAAVAAARDLAATIGHTSLATDALLDQRELLQQPGEILIETAAATGTNSVYLAEYLLPANDARLLAAGVVLGNFISQPFFNELRTRQQLGYIVSAGAGRTRRTVSLNFVIQSSTHAPDDLCQRAESFIATLPDQLADLSPAGFATLLAGARANLAATPKTVAEKTARFFSRALEFDRDWERQTAAVAAVDTLTQNELVALMQEVLAHADSRQRLVLLNAPNHQPSTVSPTFADRKDWKASRQYE